MKIRITTNLGSNEFPGMPWKVGDEHEVDSDLGALLVSRGVADDISPSAPPPKPEPAKPKEVVGVSDKPAVADPKAPSVSGSKSKGAS